MKDKNFEKCDYILQVALTTFLRYGFKKTSMDDIAKAAGITRQGLYFHFQNKDELFAASVKKSLRDSMQAAIAALDDDGSSLENKIFNALDAWFGSYAGLFGPETSDWDFHCGRVLGSDIANSNFQFCQKLKEAMIKSAGRQIEDIRVDTIVEILCICGRTWKRTADSHEKFTEKMYDAIRLCCQNL